MAAAAPVAGEAPPPTAPCSAEVMVEWMEGRGLPTDLAADSLSALRTDSDETLWHLAAQDGRIDVCEYLKSRGMLDMINEPDDYGRTP